MGREGDGDRIESIPVVRRGYDRAAVDALVENLREEKRELARLVEEAKAGLARVSSKFGEERGRLEAALEDPERASQVVGREASEVLRSATEAANALRRKAEAAGAEILEKARREAAEIERQTRLNAHGELEEAKQEARQHLDQIRLQGQEILKMSDRTAATAVEAAKREGRSLVYRAREHASQLLFEAEAKATALREEISQLELKRIALLQLLEAAGRLVGEAVEMAAEVVEGRGSEGDDLAAGEEPPEGAPAGPEPAFEAAGEEEAAEDSTHGEPASEGAPAAEVVLKPGWHDLEEVRRLIEQVAGEDEWTDAEVMEEAEELLEDASFKIAGDEAEPPRYELDDELKAGVAEAGEGEVAASGAAPPAVETLSKERLSRLEALFAELQGVSGPPGDAALAAAGDEAEPLRYELEDRPPQPHPEGGGGAAIGKDGADDFSERDLPPSLVAKYHEKLDPARADLARRVKRLFQDDLNQVLSSIRGGGRDAAQVAVDAMIADRISRSEQVRSHLSRLFVGGVEFALAVAGREEAVETRGYTQLIEEEGQRFLDDLGELALHPIRDLLSAQDGSAENELVSAVSSFFREVRNQRLDGFAEDAARAAFSLGTRSLPGATGYRWVVGAGVLPCADCEDNVLGDVTSAEDDFPTGHKRPPAHPGCRCFIIPVFA